MTYNFDEIIDRRNTNSENVEGWRPYIFHCGPERVFPYKDEEFIRMWVADMEFAVAPEILPAITALFSAKEDFLNAAKDEIERKYGDVPTYLRKAIGLQSEDIHRLRTILLE